MTPANRCRISTRFERCVSPSHSSQRFVTSNRLYMDPISVVDCGDQNRSAIAASLGTDTSEAGLAALGIGEMANAGEIVVMTNEKIAAQIQEDIAALVAASDLEDIPEAACSDESRPYAAPFGNRVDHDSAAMDEVDDVFRVDSGVSENVEHAGLQRTWRRVRLGADDAARWLDRDQIREGAADVDCDAGLSGPFVVSQGRPLMPRC